MSIEIRTSLVGLALATSILPTGSIAEDAVKPAPAVPVATKVSWVRRPNSEDLARVYPQPALNNGVSGTAIIRCVVTANGAVSHCEINDERPGGMGFGDAALRLSPLFKMTRTKADGRPTQGCQVSIPIHFNAKADAALDSK